MLSVVLLSAIYAECCYPKCHCAECGGAKTKHQMLHKGTIDFLSWGKCYKTFYGRNLRFFKYARQFLLGKPFQTSLIFVGKARSLP
jgi:hypothetical protein